jgi:hypothetical protein
MDFGLAKQSGLALLAGFLLQGITNGIKSDEV